MRKWWVLGIGVLLVAAAVVVYLKMDKSKEKPLTQAQATTRVVKGTIDVSVSGTGSLAPVNRQTIKGTEQGTVDKVYVKEGDIVKKGDVLVSIEGEDNSDKIKSEQVNLESKKLDLQDMQSKLKSATDENDIASIKLNLKKQQLSIDQSVETIADLEDAEDGDTITAPIGGKVTTLSVAAGDSLNPSTELMEIADFAHLQIAVGIDELDIAKVKVGQSATVTVEALSNQAFTGKVTKIADEGTSSNGVASFDVTVAIDKPGELKSGMSAEANIQIEKKENTLMLPIDAVQSFGGRYMVILPEGTTGTGTGTGTGAARQGNGANTQGQIGAQSGGTEGDKASQGTQGQGQIGSGTQGQGTRGQGGFGGGTGRTGSRNNFASRLGGTPTMVQVGIHNEDYIEILSGLKEGDRVVLPTVVSSTNTNQQQAGFGAGGFGGLGGGSFGGGFGGGGGGNFRAAGGGGFGGGGGGARTSGGGGGGGGTR